MYYPFLRARQFELIALRELANEDATQGVIIPILEPVKETNNNLTLAHNLLQEKNQSAYLIVNPSIGELAGDSPFYLNYMEKLENAKFLPAVYVKEAIQGKLLKDRISRDLSKPMRRYDSELEYIPTQFICEYIKVFTGAKGIRFRSSLHEQGNNIVFFEPELMECKSVKKVKIKNLDLSSIVID